MARVKAFEIGGVDTWFPSGDHEPPHFHARRPGEWSARVFFMEGEPSMIRDVKPPSARINGADRRAIVRGVEHHRAELLLEWEACRADP